MSLTGRINIPLSVVLSLAKQHNAMKYDPLGAWCSTKAAATFKLVCTAVWTLIHRKIALAVIVSFGQLLISYCFCWLLRWLHPFTRMDPLSSGSCGRLFQADLGRNVHPCNPAGRFHYASVVGLGHLCRHGRILDPASKSVVPAHSFPPPQYQVSSSACHGHIPSYTHIPYWGWSYLYRDGTVANRRTSNGGMTITHIQCVNHRI